MRNLCVIILIIVVSVAMAACRSGRAVDLTGRVQTDVAPINVPRLRTSTLTITLPMAGSITWHYRSIPLLPTPSDTTFKQNDYDKR